METTTEPKIEGESETEMYLRQIEELQAENYLLKEQIEEHKQERARLKDYANRMAVRFEQKGN